MKSIKLLFTLFAVLAAGIYFGCSVDYPDSEDKTFDPNSQSGRANFSVYVAIGNSLTAGVQSSGPGPLRGLREDFQKNSYPALIARQINRTGNNFRQPLLAGDGYYGYIKFGNPPFVNGQPNLIPSMSNPTLMPTETRPYHNLGVPGALLIEILTAKSKDSSISNEVMFDVVLNSQGTAIEQADSLNPTFVTFWLGNNEVLGPVTRYGSGTAVVPSTDFGKKYRQAILAVKNISSHPDIAVATIPYVTSIPFVTTISPVLAKSPAMIYAIGTDGATSRSMTANDYILLTAKDSLKIGVGVPLAAGGTGRYLPDNLWMSSDEVNEIKTTIDAYNDSIKSIAACYNIAVFDANKLLNKIREESIDGKTGYNIGSGIKVKTDFISGGIFSFDGVHPNTLGYAMIANEFIKTINAYYDSDIPLLNLQEFMD